uniref:Coiled-coil domain containing 9 n=1 Tax=Apteryx owenii TaxID=8824 RepID=A0A8B9S5S2_APTOW
MSATLDLKSKEEKDAELDKRIEALRKKNEALIKRYQEIEEDRKKAEQEGIAVTALRRSGEGQRSGRGRRSRGRGAASLATGGDTGPDRKSKEWEERRRQNIEKMNEEMEKIAEYERNQRDGLHEKNPVRNFLDDPRRSGPFQDADRKEGSRRHIRNWGGADFDKVKTGMEREKGRRSGPKAGGTLDMTLSMTGRERAEYVRWKKEREQIDQERLARHRKPTGQWRREWDAEKTDTMYVEKGDCPHYRDEKKRPPKPPTFGEFLSPHRTERRRKGRGRGRSQGAGAKPYRLGGLECSLATVHRLSLPQMVLALCRQVDELASAAFPEPQPSVNPEEDEDQWEDVSEEEEEEEDSPGSSGEDEAPPSTSPKAQRPPKAGQAAAPRLHMPPVAPSTGGGPSKPLSPFSPVEGHQPVSDWAEEMDLASPRSSLGDSPLPGPPAPPDQSRGASGETAGEGDTEAAPGTVEITDFERVRFRKNSPSPAGR